MIGVFSKTTDSNLIEAAGYSNLDFIILDQEHGLISSEKMYDHIRAAHVSNLIGIVRVKEANHNFIGSAFDAGADGVLVPNVSSLKEAKLAINAARFFPSGTRGVCRFVKAANFGFLEKEKYFTKQNKKILIFQIEGVQGIENLNSILALDGFDGIFIGPYDLAQSAGYPGQINHPIVLEYMKSIIDVVLTSGKELGIFSDAIRDAKEYYKAGFTYLAYSVDLNIFSNACNEIVKNIKS